AFVAISSLSDTTDVAVDEARATLADDVVGARVADTSEQVAREIAVYLDERIADARAMARAPLVIDAAIDAGIDSFVTGWYTDDIEVNEARFAESLRHSRPEAARELNLALNNSPGFLEVSFTDEYGFTVDYTRNRPTETDWVQSDEVWWIEAFETGFHVASPHFDETAGEHAVDFAVRIEDSGRRPVGVLKATLAIDVVESIVDGFTGDDFEVTVVEQLGRYLAETATDHSADRVLVDSVNAAETGNASVLEGLSPDGPTLHPDGYSINDDVVAGFAHTDTPLASLEELAADDLAALDWLVVVEQPSETAFAALTPLDGLRTDVADTSSGLGLLIVLITVVGVAAAGLFSWVFARRITAPIEALRDAAVATAEHRLPGVVAQIDELGPDDDLPELEPVVVTTGDEVEDLASSFNAVQQTAAALAAEQARLRRRNVATTFVNLGRRNQSLLARQLEHINTMENSETDSDTLRRLFQLDHLATRMRRNAESLLVLAGEETPRRFRKPVSVHQLLQAAGGEIEDFSRIEILGLDDAGVEGSVASDVAHLLAELLENAGHFAPPGTPIQVLGRSTAHGYVLSVTDHGIGMEASEFAAANARLEDPAEFDRAPSAYLGLFVVGHLARKHGLKVKLGPSMQGGVTAQIGLPRSVLATANPLPGLAAVAAPTESATPAPTPAFDEAFRPVDPVAGGPARLHQHTPTAPIAAPVQPQPQPTAPAQPAAPPQSVPAPQLQPQPQPQLQPQPQPQAQPQPQPQAQPQPQSVETTPSGFRKRRRGQEGAPVSAPATGPAVAPTAPAAPRDPAKVRSSLTAIRAGVAQGRAAADQSPPPQPPTERGGDPE
ncbi:MAG: sensor histidine kinase, partial [Actinomycetota bacterium]